MRLARQGRAEHAREQRLELARQRKRDSEHISKSQASSCALVCPGSGPLLGVQTPSLGQALRDNMRDVLKLAVSPRFRGSGPAVEKARAIQDVSVALVANTMLLRQKQGLQLWLGNQGHRSAQDAANKLQPTCPSAHTRTNEPETTKRIERLRRAAHCPHSRTFRIQSISADRPKSRNR